MYGKLVISSRHKNENARYRVGRHRAWLVLFKVAQRYALGKLIIMGTDAQGASRGGASGTGAALPAGYFDDVSRVVAIYERLKGLEALVDGLRSTTESNVQEIKQLTQRVYAISYIKKDVAQNTRDLNQLETRHSKELKGLEREVNGLSKRLGKEIGDLKNVVDTASTLGKMAFAVAAPVAAAIIIAVLVFIYHAVERLLK